MKENNNTTLALIAIPVIGVGAWMLTRAANAANTSAILKNLDVDFKTLKVLGVKQGKLLIDWTFDVANPLDRTLHIEYVNLEARYKGRKFADIDYKTSVGKDITIQPKGFQVVKFPSKTSIVQTAINLGVEALKSLLDKQITMEHTATITGSIWLNSQRFEINKEVNIEGLTGAIDDIEGLLRLLLPKK